MKSLIKESCKCGTKSKRDKSAEPAKEKPVAQCCAKVSKVVAGCHD